MWVKKVTDFLRFCYLNIPCLKINITLIFMYSSSDEFMHVTAKSQKQTFLLVSGGHLCLSKGHQHGVSKQSHIIWANVNPNILHMNYCTDLILGKAFCIFIFFHFPDAELSVLTGLHFHF